MLIQAPLAGFFLASQGVNLRLEFVEMLPDGGLSAPLHFRESNQVVMVVMFELFETFALFHG